MRQRRQSFNRREKRALARIVAAALLFSMLFLSVAPGCSLQSYLRVNRKTTALSAENEQLLQEIVQLRKEIQLLQHDVQYLEKIAREKYGMLKSNEEVYNVNPIAPDPAEPQVTPEGEIEGDVP